MRFCVKLKIFFILWMPIIVTIDWVVVCLIEFCLVIPFVSKVDFSQLRPENWDLHTQACQKIESNLL